MAEHNWTPELCRSYAEGLRPVVRHDHRRWAQRIAAELGAQRARPTVVDVATGPGFLLRELAPLLESPTLIGQDASGHMLEIARQELGAAGYDLQTVESPAERIALDAKVADVVTCKQLLHEVADPGQVLREIARILKPGGRAFVIDFDANGSRLSARLVWGFLRLTRGAEIAANYWRSFSAGLPGVQVHDVMGAAGLEAVCHLAGPNYFIVARRPGGA